MVTSSPMWLLPLDTDRILHEPPKAARRRTHTTGTRGCRGRRRHLLMHRWTYTDPTPRERARVGTCSRPPPLLFAAHNRRLVIVLGRVRIPRPPSPSVFSLHGHLTGPRAVHEHAPGTVKMRISSSVFHARLITMRYTLRMSKAPPHGSLIFGQANKTRWVLYLAVSSYQAQDVAYPRQCMLIIWRIRLRGNVFGADVLLSWGPAT